MSMTAEELLEQLEKAKNLVQTKAGRDSLVLTSSAGLIDMYDDCARVIKGLMNFDITASDNTDYSLTCKDGVLFTVYDEAGVAVAEFIKSEPEERII